MTPSGGSSAARSRKECPSSRPLGCAGDRSGGPRIRGAAVPARQRQVGRPVRLPAPLEPAAAARGRALRAGRHDGAVPPILHATTHRLDRPGRGEQLRNLATRSGTGRSSLQESLLHGRDLQRRLTALLAEIDADLEVYDTVRFGQYLASRRRRDEQRVVYLNDLFSERYAAMCRTLRAYPEVQLDALGDFADNVPGPLRSIVRRRSVQTAALAVERRLVRRSERRMAVSLTPACWSTRPRARCCALALGGSSRPCRRWCPRPRARVGRTTVGWSSSCSACCRCHTTTTAS